MKKKTQILKNVLVLGTMTLISLQSMASDKTDANWTQQLKANGLNADAQSYCYTGSDGKLQGDNVNLRIRLASVSKLVTTFWASETLGLNHTFDTKLYIKGNNLHIQGSYDPFMGDEKMFFLVSQLNDLGYTKFDTITFDKNVMINPDVIYDADEYPTMNSVTNGRYLKMYFNPSTWSQHTKDEYTEYQTLAKAGRLRKSVAFDVANVKFVDANPFEGDAEAKVLTLTSPILAKYVKKMNVQSNNYVAENLFRQLGGTQKFTQFLADRLKLTTDQMQFFTGSGLPATIDGDRKDNYSTCSIMMNIVSELKKSAEKQTLELEDIMAVPGSDGGTFRNRIISADLKNSFVAKTGTLMHTSTLAGAMNTQTGFSFFGIFNQSTDISASKVVQNSMVKSIMADLGGPKAFDYEVEGFHAYTGDNVKDLDLSDVNEVDDFSSIEGNLQ